MEAAKAALQREQSARRAAVDEAARLEADMQSTNADLERTQSELERHDTEEVIMHKLLAMVFTACMHRWWMGGWTGVVLSVALLVDSHQTHSTLNNLPSSLLRRTVRMKRKWKTRKVMGER